MNRIQNFAISLYHLLVKPITKFPQLIAVFFTLIIIPGFINFIINYPALKKILLVDFCQALALSYIFGWICMGMGRRIRLTIASVIAVLSFIVSIIIIVSNRPFSTVTILLITQTDIREAESFIHQFVTPYKIFWGLLLFVFYIAIIYCLKYDYCKFHQISKKWFTGIWLCLVAFGLVRLADFCTMYRYTTLYEFEKWYAKPSNLSKNIIHLDEYRNGDLITSLLFAFRGFHLNTKELPKWKNVQLEVISKQIRHSDMADSINVVVIIGESFIKNHSNLYGYPLKTNPRLTSEFESKNLVVFNDYISSANFTAESLRNTLQLNDLSQGEYWSESPYFPLVISKSGWKVHLYDNQFTTPKGMADVQLVSMMRNALLDRECYEWTNDSIDIYDEDFIDRINLDFPFNNSVGNFDIYHLYGQHFAPSDRYPNTQENNYFSQDSIPYQRPWLTPDKKQIVAEYDNATKYNDKVIGKILDRYKLTPSVIIYFSDHGEEMYDTSDCDVRNEPSGDIKGWLKRQFEIPFFVWASDSYIRLFPDKWQAIIDAKNRPGMLDNLGQSVLGLCGITDSVYYRPERDIFNSLYKHQDRITSGRFINYDKIINKPL